MPTQSDPSALLAAIREDCKPGLWARGVAIAREGAVALESRGDNEVELRVKAAGRVVPVSVVLYVQDKEWDCDCGGHLNPCEHVVAAAISLRHDGDDSTSGRPALTNTWSRVVYRFRRLDGGLAVTRTLVQADGSEVALEGSLTSLVAGSGRDTLQVEQLDLAADRLLDHSTKSGALAPNRLDAVLKALVGARTVLLDGRPVAIPDEEVLPAGRVEEKAGKWIVTIDRAPEVEEVVARGVLLCGDSLMRAGETELTGRSLEKLPAVRVLPSEQLGELISTVLPELARRIPVEVLSKRLPRVDRELTPYVACEITTLDDGVSILPTLVYGTPPCVRIDSGNMVFLGGAVPLRDEAAEQRLSDRLREDVNLVIGRRSTVPLSDVPRVAEQLTRLHCRLGGDADRLVRSDVRLVPTLVDGAGESLSQGAGFALGLAFEVEGGEAGTRVDAADVARAWGEGHGLVALDGGGFAPVPHEWLAVHGHVLADLLAARGSDGSVPASAAPTLNALFEALDHPAPPSLERLLPLWDELNGVPEPALPEGLKATLRPYQRRGFDWLSFLQSAHMGGILADDMGLGKTLQTIAVLGTRALVVAPTSVLSNWRAELERFRPSLRVGVYHGPGRELGGDVDVVLTTYAILRLDKELLSSRRWDAVVLDEAQAIKNPLSQVARAAFGLNADFRLALSGTPVENRLEELWSLMHFVNPGLLGGRREFEERTARPIGDGDAKAAARLRKRIGPFVLRRMKRDVAPELPPRIESVLHVQLDDRERGVYDAVMAATQKEVVALLEQGGGGVMKALEALLRLRQAACHTGLLPGQDATSSSKVKALVDALTSAVDNGHKALVFSQWTSLLDRVEPALEAAGIGFDRLDGSTKDRGAVTERFSSASGAPVLLMSLKAGGTGLNLTAADHVFLLDPWWNPAAEAQAADRAHRIGQDRTVFVYRLVTEGTVEEKILLLQDKKRALLEAAVGDASTASGLGRQDLLDLLA